MLLGVIVFFRVLFGVVSLLVVIYIIEIFFMNIIDISNYDLVEFYMKYGSLYNVKYIYFEIYLVYYFIVVILILVY